MTNLQTLTLEELKKLAFSEFKITPQNLYKMGLNPHQKKSWIQIISERRNNLNPPKKQRGLKTLPTIKTTIYFYKNGAKK